MKEENQFEQPKSKKVDSRKENLEKEIGRIDSEIKFLEEKLGPTEEQGNISEEIKTNLRIRQNYKKKLEFILEQIRGEGTNR